MLSERFHLALSVLLGLLPVFYGGIIIATLPYTLQWAAVVGVVLVTLLALFAWMDWPIQTIWPIFPGVILIMAGTIALYQGDPNGGPLTRAPDALLLTYVPAAFYILWGARATWKASHIY